MKKTLRITAVLLLIAAMVFSAAACGGGDSGTTTGEAADKTTEKPSETEKVTDKESDSQEPSGEAVHIVYGVSGTNREEYWSRVVADFNAAHPDIVVELQCYEDFDTKVNSLYAANMGPDVMYGTLMAQGVHVPKKHFAPITDYVNAWDEWEDFAEGPRILGNFDGVQYGVPIFSDARVVLYNKDLLDSAGLEPPKTWDDLVEIQEKLTVKEADGTYSQVGVAVPSTGTQMMNFFAIFCLENGMTSFVDEVTNEINFNKPECVEAAEFIKKLYDMGSIVYDSADASLDPFLDGKAAVSITYTNNYKAAKERGLNVGAAEPLTKVRQHTFGGTHFLYLGEGTDQAKKDAAFEFIKFAESADEMWTRYEEMGFVVLRESLKDRYIAEDPDANAAYYASATHSTGSARTTYTAIVHNSLNAHLQDMLLNGVSPKDALDAAADEVQLEIDNL